MTDYKRLPRVLQNLLEQATRASGPQLVAIANNPLVRRLAIREAEKLFMAGLKDSRSDPEALPGVSDDRTLMGIAIAHSIERALGEKHLSDDYIRGILQLLVKNLFLEGGEWSKVEEWKATHGQRSPSFLLISPGKACNLHCIGCYADSDDQRFALEWSLVDQIIADAKSMWGTRFFVISGGEPFAYRSEGKTLMDLMEKHSDCFFMLYTNSTLIDEALARRLSKAGNALLCISIEGWRERTDERRGAGVFDRIVNAMALLREHKVPFGLSMTATKYNAEEILSDEFLDYFIERGALFSWVFQYMPIGRSYTLDLMVTPQQRLWMWHRSWEIIRQRKFFLADFWNHGTTVDGCLSAGGHGHGGYFYIDWNGAVSPCVFMPYSPVNIREIYARGGNVTDIWEEPFFAALRQWQRDYMAGNRNGLAPCPNRDHHDELEQLLREYEPDPSDTNAAETLIDPEYTRGLVEYNREFEALTHEIWQKHYVAREVPADGSIAPLPDIASLYELGADGGSTDPGGLAAD